MTCQNRRRAINHVKAKKHHVCDQAVISMQQPAGLRVWQTIEQFFSVTLWAELRVQQSKTMQWEKWASTGATAPQAGWLCWASVQLYGLIYHVTSSTERLFRAVICCSFTHGPSTSPAYFLCSQWLPVSYNSFGQPPENQHYCWIHVFNQIYTITIPLPIYHSL